MLFNSFGLNWTFSAFEKVDLFFDQWENKSNAFIKLRYWCSKQKRIYEVQPNIPSSNLPHLDFCLTHAKFWFQFTCHLIHLCISRPENVPRIYFIAHFLQVCVQNGRIFILIFKPYCASKGITKKQWKWANLFFYFSHFEIRWTKPLISNFFTLASY